MKIDFSRVADDYGRYRPGYPDRLQKILTANGLIRSDFHILEVGCGTGQFTQLLIKSGASVTAVDESDRMLELAKLHLCNQLSRQEFICGDFTDDFITDRHYDTIFFAQSWHLLDPNVRALNAHQSLSRGGKICIVYNSRLEEIGGLVSATNAMIRRHNPIWEHGGEAGIYSEYLREIDCAGFEDLETLSFDWSIPYDFDQWRGRILASKGVGASMSPAVLDCFLADFDQEIAQFFNLDVTVPVRHRIFCLIATK
jgi:SAM-dependent methyltransferase